MIHDINAQSREHIFYDTLKGVLLYHNDLANYPLHWHNEVELILLLSGSLKVKFHNDSSAVVNCMPGDIMMIAPGTLHEYISDAPGGEKLILLFDLATYSQVSSLVPLIKTLPPYTHISQNLYPVEVARLQNYFWEIDRLYGQQDEFLQISVYSLVSLILAQIGSMHLNDAIPNRDTGDSQYKNIDKLVEVTNYIDSHRSDDLTVEQLADLAGFSKFHFERLFKAYMGVSCYQYITKRRVLMAQELLGDTDLSVMDIALQSGFFSLSTFNRVFKDINKCSPTEYRKLYRTGADSSPDRANS
ncbi:transcriptional regulator AraC family [Butyrivibrio proteoclasticus B316]|jgi:AraC-like DNA-binding protein|uniref:Transcriptional regulator AraC family n=1 Tax=Butyrivibrio proteoclasticus (strain ATCC 51982 / DSM 14932 / B316) TaxID=515622 RepID=E0RW60_BUTPB|nr:AraC family transcriptional regulator [Butyrivibrio proteoclasticus]ADL32926.1 transcriptional regulator AraC family [Butyrivibrio proteoclasticus B316]